ncbi:MAG TPA: O-antigen ligase family protein, partial [Pyrinomonadaceae bacterium]
MKDEKAAAKVEQFMSGLKSSSLIPHPSSLAAWLERALTLSIFLLVVCAPLTIAGTQGAWLLAGLLWLIRLGVRPKTGPRRTPLDYWLLGFFVLTFFSALLSYDPDVSIGKLRAASLFTIVYVVAENVTSPRVLRALVIALVASCAASNVYTFGVYVIGRGVRIDALAADSPLHTLGLRPGDTVLEVNGQRLRGPEPLARALDSRAAPDGGALTVRLLVHRLEAYPLLDYPRLPLPEGRSAAERLGLVSWSRGRDVRAAGTYGHYTTYAEVLQLVASLVAGLLVALRRKASWRGVLLAAALAGMCGALILTVTRASWLGLLLSALVIASAGAGRRTLLIAAGLALPLILGALFVLQQKRQVGFIDPQEGSTAWRLTVWSEAVGVLVSEPRHLLVGVGRDTLKRHWREWGMFDGGRLPWGHLHSTPLQIAFERGLPALLVWLGLLAAYARMLWRLARRGGGGGEESLGWVERGLALGALGGTVGFFTSGLVHYNLGDSEVVMVFYLVMGLALA